VKALAICYSPILPKENKTIKLLAQQYKMSVGRRKNIGSFGKDRKSGT
jgi:hypothetical protein